MLKVNNISKYFSGNAALNGVSLTLHEGMVNAIIGENGAGKSTLMKILSGVIPSYEGTIYLDGHPVRFKNTQDATAAGISIIHQELNLIPGLSIAANIFLGKELTTSTGMLDDAAMQNETKRLLQLVHLHVDPSIPVGQLRVGQQQQVEIAKALHANARLIIMDEPTSALSELETQNLFLIINQLKNENKTIAYISHRFNELFAIADKFIVLRDGQTVGEGNIKETNETDLIKMMSGREKIAQPIHPSHAIGKVLMQVKNLQFPYPVSAAGKLSKPFSFDLHEGEILGIYGLMGAGRTELLETIFGLNKSSKQSSILLEGKPMQINSPGDAIAAGIVLVPEDRKRQGLVMEQSVKSNLVITALDKILNGLGLISSKKETAMAGQFSSALKIKASSDRIAVSALSGGNQQKIVLAKWLALDPSVLLLDEPTRGVDVSAKAEIYDIMRSFAAKGKGVIMASSELPEIMAVSHRILVICEGEIAATLKTNETNAENVLAHAIQKHQ